MKSYQIHLIRHAACEETRKGEYVGTKDVPLSKEGIAELKRLDEKFDYPGAPVIFTSPLKRCLQTCEIVYPALKPIVINELRECSFGEWEGRTADSLSNNEDFKKWLAGDTTVKPPKGESGAEFTRRVCNIFKDIVDGLIKTGTTNCIIVTWRAVNKYVVIPFAHLLKHSLQAVAKEQLRGIGRNCTHRYHIKILVEFTFHHHVV